MKSSLCTAAFLLLLTHGVFAAETAPAFSLKRWGTNETVRLSDFAGRIVVLDFFAWWCGPCAKSAPEIEEHIQKHYAGKKGNPHGVLVQVVSVNVEEEEPEKTAAFIRKHGVSLVVNDRDGETLKNYGGEGLPHFVIVDGTGATASSPAFRIVHRSTGFEGADAMRQAIDAIKPAAKP
jgi:cytochrome c biogenesis protein CcmG, thiol:disulfide interchange protein DsbE